MPRQPRKLTRPPGGKAAKEPQTEALVRPSPGSHVTEVLRFRCPICGMMPTANRLEQAPYELALYLQRFGGRLPGSKVGYMEYIPLTEAAEIETFLELELMPILQRVYETYSSSKSRAKIKTKDRRRNQQIESP